MSTIIYYIRSWLKWLGTKTFLNVKSVLKLKLFSIRSLNG